MSGGKGRGMFGGGFCIVCRCVVGVCTCRCASVMRSACAGTTSTNTNPNVMLGSRILAVDLC